MVNEVCENILTNLGRANEKKNLDGEIIVKMFVVPSWRIDCTIKITRILLCNYNFYKNVHCAILFKFKLFFICKSFIENRICKLICIRHDIFRLKYPKR